MRLFEVSSDIQRNVKFLENIDFIFTEFRFFPDEAAELIAARPQPGCYRKVEMSPSRINND